DAKLRNSFIISLITQVYVELASAATMENAETPQHRPSYIEKFKAFEKLLEQHFKSEKSPEKYASRLNITAKHLNRINKEMVGETTSEIITKRVMLEARRMLIHSRSNLSEIAYELGFEDYAYFSKLFKKHNGISPLDFRSRHL
ncbi:MAG: AraC family transcriptional regulator, partial [Proteobacteria bacterium]